VLVGVVGQPTDDVGTTTACRERLAHRACGIGDERFPCLVVEVRVLGEDDPDIGIVGRERDAACVPVGAAGHRVPDEVVLVPDRFAQQLCGRGRVQCHRSPHFLVAVLAERSQSVWCVGRRRFLVSPALVRHIASLPCALSGGPVVSARADKRPARSACFANVQRGKPDVGRVPAVHRVS